MKRKKEFFIILDNSYIDKFDEIVVIGDIHGCNTEFEEILDKIHNETPSKNPKKCLKILVGDLVNKGPYNEKVLENCCDKFSSSILAVRGNHDEIVLREYFNFKKNSHSLMEKNNWIKDLPDRYIHYLLNLPYTITIPCLNCIIVHAGLNPFLPNEQAANDINSTKHMTTMRNIIGETQTLTKYNEGEAWASFWKGPQHVYFGHDARRRMQDQHPFATGLDTGCVYGDRLTGVYIKGPRKGQFVVINAKMMYEPMTG